MMATTFSYHLMPWREEKDVALVIQTHVSRVATDWDLSVALPTELQHQSNTFLHNLDLGDGLDSGLGSGEL